MLCLFCKSPSGDACSEEHIVPQSLGGAAVLPPGVVCDRCNNYFARKVEGPLLDDPWFVQKRFRHAIQNKRDRVPPLRVMSVPGPVACTLVRHRDGSASVGVEDDNESDHWVRSIAERGSGSLILPVVAPPSGLKMARFLGKVALEALAARSLCIPRGVDELAEHSGLEELRRFVRVGDRPSAWPIHVRPLYEEDRILLDSDGAPYQVLHEYTLLYTPSGELYFVMAIFGWEFSMNMGGPCIDGYEAWLRAASGGSPLYSLGPP